MYKMLGPEVRVMVTNSVAIRAMVIFMVVVMDRPMPWMPMSSKVRRHVSLKGINQDHLVIILIGLMNLSQKIEFKNCSL